MKEFFGKVIERILESQLKEVPISQIRSESREVSISEGWGGKHIKYFPPCQHFKMYVSGKREIAKENMKNWYYNRFITNKLFLIPKDRGGMYKGSLYNEIEEICESLNIKINYNTKISNNEVILKGIDRIVERRFILLDSIIKNGFKNGCDKISFKKNNNEYIIVNGHHRVAALYICGYNKIKGINKKNIIVNIILKLFYTFFYK